ncbi:ribosomal RNA-processing protein 14-C-like [Acanthaster planci]|uniref:Ribosomal RNA-processing protein 14-C-like n=1 Tax=Acanthaster planci TaxID=133434 RepID=A0A8B7XYQ0_ACAPL|nr:ribosomal RNA-processing protein 14-C-like [Acanthaster planci]XP_022085161.1 ribosomal RNA-processing protein 14-C-like [Acanthaster planci]
MTNSCVDKMGDDSALRKSLLEKNEYFKKMVDLIPAKYYLDKETKKAGEKFYKNIKEEAPRQEFKDKSTKLSRKKQRMDPDAKQELKVTDLQDALALKEVEREKRRQEKIRQERKEAEADKTEEGGKNNEESSGDEMEGLEGGLQGLGESDSKDWSSRRVAQPISVEKIQSSASINDLRRKVREKIEQMRQQRHAKSLAGNAVMSKKAAKQVQEADKKKMRKQETYQAIKASREQKRKEREKQRTVNGGRKEEEGVDLQEGEAEVQGTSKVSFSKFDFEESRESKKSKKKKTKRKAGEEKLSGRDYEGLLKKVQAKKQKINEVKKSNPDAAEDMIKQDKWRAALDRAEGKKVRDDPELLKKSIRKKKEKKKHSEKKWTERKQKTKELMDERQKKRRTNLKGRRDARKAKKVKRLQKKGKLLLKDSDY